MRRSAVRLLKATTALGCLVAAGLPLAAHAAEVTFDWVPISENPASAQTTTASGSITIDLASWSLTNSSNPPPNYGPYYTSGSAMTGTITAFSYTAADGLSVDLADLSTMTIGAPTTQAATLWATTSIETPATGAQAPSVPTAGYYLTTAFSVSGKTAQGTTFMVASNTGRPGATFQSGAGSGDVTFQADGSAAAIEDGGYWELAPPAPVPLPAGLPELLGGLGLLAWFVQRQSNSATESTAGNSSCRRAALELSGLRTA